MTNVKNVIGTDFGTSNSGTVVWKNETNQFGEELFLPIGNLLYDSGKHFPSFVSYNEQAVPVDFGVGAQAMLQMDPKHTIYDFKRLIGRRFDEPEFQSYRPFLTYDVDKDDNGQIVIKIGNHTLMPEDVAADLMVHMLKTALTKFEDLVIERWLVSVPANYDATKRLKTKKAAMIAIEKLRKSTIFNDRIRLPDYSNTEPADVQEIQLVSEPTAALHTYLAYLARKKATIPLDKYIILFDLGAGTLDITIGQVTQEVDPFTNQLKDSLRVILLFGNNDLGGRRMDEKIYEYVETKIREQLQLEGRSHDFTDATRIELKHAVEMAKIKLSRITSTEIYLEKEKISFILDRSTMEKQIQEILANVRKEIQYALRGNPIKRISKDEIGVIILVGGPSKMPCIREIVEEETIAIESIPNWDPLMCVAEGAARYGVNPAATTEPPSHKYSLAVEIMKDVVVPWEIATTGDILPIKGRKEVLVQRNNASDGIFTNTISFLTQDRKDNGKDKIFNQFSFAVGGGQGKSAFTIKYPWKRIIHCNDLMNHEISYNFDTITVEYFINQEGLLKKPKFIDHATGVEIVIPDVPILDYGFVQTTDLQTFERNRESMAFVGLENGEKEWDSKINEIMRRDGKNRQQAELEFLTGKIPPPPPEYKQVRILTRAALVMAKKYNLNPGVVSQYQRTYDTAQVDSEANNVSLRGVVNGVQVGLSGRMTRDQFFEELVITANGL